MTDMTDIMDDTPRPEFSRPVEVERLDGILVREIEATEDERTALAGRLGLLGLEALTARLRLVPLADGAHIRAEGHMTARVVQSCGITLEPVVSCVDESFERTYTFEAPTRPDPGQDIELEPEGDEPPDPIVGGMIDLGELVVEELCLAIDPFPRAEGAVFDAEAAGVAEGKETPFSVLAKLRSDER